MEVKKKSLDLSFFIFLSLYFYFKEQSASFCYYCDVLLPTNSKSNMEITNMTEKYELYTVEKVAVAIYQRNY